MSFKSFVSRLKSLLSSLSFAFFLASCTSGKVMGGLYIDEARGFKVPLLQEGWQRIELPEVVLAFQDEAGKATIALFLSCEGEGKVPLKVLARRLFFGLKDRRILEQRTLSLNRAEAIQTILQGRVGEEEVKVSSYVVKGPGCLYDLVYFAKPEAFDEGLDDFERFARGLEFLRRRPEGSEGRGL